MTQDLVGNRQARHHYEILDTYEAGVMLLGTEVKSLRTHHGSLGEAYVVPEMDHLVLVNAHIPPYSHGNRFNHEERRPRKLLMHRKEIRKLRQQVAEKGLTLIPLGFYLKKGIIKLRLGLARGKKSYDKREAIKERQDKLAMQRAMKEHS